MCAVRQTLAFIIMILAGTPQLSAQTQLKRFEAGAFFAFMQQRVFDVRDLGLGGRFTYYPWSFLGVEGEAGLFPSGLIPGSSRSNISGNRTSVLFGIKAGTRFRHWGIFSKARPGFIHFARSPQGIACVAILVYPPPLECSLSKGSTRFALDLGNVVEWYPTPRFTIRLDIGDTMVRFPPAFTRFGQFKQDFNVHNLQINAGIGYRFD